MVGVRSDRFLEVRAEFGVDWSACDDEGVGVPFALSESEFFVTLTVASKALKWSLKGVLSMSQESKAFLDFVRICKNAKVRDTCLNKFK